VGSGVTKATFTGERNFIHKCFVLHCKSLQLRKYYCGADLHSKCVQQPAR
jgi:hypothetical protein